MATSIKAKIVLFYMAVLTAALTVFAVLLYFSLEKMIYGAVDAELLSAARTLAAQVQETEDEAEFRNPDAGMSGYPARPVSGRYYQIRLPDGSVLKKSASLGPQDLPDVARPDAAGFQTMVFMGSPVRMVTLTVPPENGDTAVKGPIIVQYAEDIRDSVNLLASYRMILALAVIGILALSSSGGFLIARKALRPVAEISRTIGAISESNLSERVAVTKFPRELGDLAASFNRTFDSLEKSFNRQKQFVSDLSHEMRTPLAVITSHSEIALRKERTPSEYRAALSGIFDTSRMMSRWAQKLLTLVRMDEGRTVLQFESLNVADVVAETIQLLKPIAMGKDIDVSVSSEGRKMIVADRAALLEVFMNILDNAVKYNRTGGKIHIVIRCENGRVVVDIADTGIGIPEKDLNHVLDRFYRADVSRSKEIEGAGLGLSICDEIMKRHGGRISIRSNVNEGTTVSLYFKKTESSF